MMARGGPIKAQCANRFPLTFAGQLKRAWLPTPWRRRDSSNFATRPFGKKPPPGNQWLHEIKADGYRAQTHVNDKNVTVYSRSGYNWTDRFPTIAEAARKLPARQAILDGEAVVMGANGIPDFQALRCELSRKDSKRVVYLAFDLLYLDGRDLRQRPYVERKRELQALLAGAPEILSYVEYLEGDGQEAFPPRLPTRSKVSCASERTRP